jgi:hypothetical protein
VLPSACSFPRGHTLKGSNCMRPEVNGLLNYLKGILSDPISLAIESSECSDFDFIIIYNDFVKLYLLGT